MMTDEDFYNYILKAVNRLQDENMEKKAIIASLQKEVEELSKDLEDMKKSARAWANSAQVAVNQLSEAKEKIAAAEEEIAAAEEKIAQFEMDIEYKCFHLMTPSNGVAATRCTLDSYHDGHHHCDGKFWDNLEWMNKVECRDERKGYFCTLYRGHTGAHVTIRDGVQVATWDNKVELCEVVTHGFYCTRISGHDGPHAFEPEKKCDSTYQGKSCVLKVGHSEHHEASSLWWTKAKDSTPEISLNELTKRVIDLEDLLTSVCDNCETRVADFNATSKEDATLCNICYHRMFFIENGEIKSCDS